eukprot:gene32371-39148_t
MKNSTYTGPLVIGNTTDVKQVDSLDFRLQRWLEHSFRHRRGLLVLLLPSLTSQLRLLSGVLPGLLNGVGDLVDIAPFSLWLVLASPSLTKAYRKLLLVSFGLFAAQKIVFFSTPPPLLNQSVAIVHNLQGDLATAVVNDLRNEGYQLALVNVPGAGEGQGMSAFTGDSCSPFIPSQVLRWLRDQDMLNRIDVYVGAQQLTNSQASHVNPSSLVSLHHSLYASCLQLTCMVTALSPYMASRARMQRRRGSGKIVIVSALHRDSTHTNYTTSLPHASSLFLQGMSSDMRRDPALRGLRLTSMLVPPRHLTLEGSGRCGEAAQAAEALRRVIKGGGGHVVVPGFRHYFYHQLVRKLLPRSVRVAGAQITRSLRGLPDLWRDLASSNISTPAMSSSDGDFIEQKQGVRGVLLSLWTRPVLDPRGLGEALAKLRGRVARMWAGNVSKDARLADAGGTEGALEEEERSLREYFGKLVRDADAHAT